MIQNVLILGAGSAGLLAAITLKKKLPQLDVRVVRSSDIGVIGVGEGTTPAIPLHLFDYLQLDKARFYAQAEPTWKLSIRFHWGPRDYFDCPFAFQLSGQWCCNN
jgi:tryptophan halogenase